MEEFTNLNLGMEECSHQNLEMEMHSILKGNDVLVPIDEKFMPKTEETQPKIDFMELMSQALDYVKKQPEYNRSRTSFGLDKNELMIDFNGSGEFDMVVKVSEFFNR